MITMRILFLAVPLMFITAAHAKPEKMILCPTAKISGCQVVVDPLGNIVQPVMCPASRCRVDRPKIVNGQKVCTFTCPEFFID